MRNDISIFEFLKDARDVPHFLKGLSKTNLLAANVVFRCVVSNCEEYSKARESKLMDKMNKTIDEGNYVWFIDEFEMTAAINMMAFTDPKNKNAMKYLLESGFASQTRRDVGNLVSRIKVLIKSVEAEEWILPHLKLALAYCYFTSNSQS